MSQHVVEDLMRKYVFGWDHPLMSFFLQVHDKRLSEEDNPVAWFGGAVSDMYEVEELVKVARGYGLDIPIVTQAQLFREKDEGI